MHVWPDGKRMEMHKKLLASISPELNKHVNNDMREGIEGIIHFTDEGEEMLTLFIEWAYTGDYACEDEPEQDPWPSLHKHLQLCVFADKFNVPTLKELAESRFHSQVNRATVKPNSGSDVAGLIILIGYAYNNLPSSDPVLKFLAQYAAWNLELLRGETSFNNLILAQPDFLKELLMNVGGPKIRPTVPQKHTPQAVTTLNGKHYRPKRGRHW